MSKKRESILLSIKMVPIAGLTVTVIFLMMLPLSQAQTPIDVFAIHSNPYGTAYSDWTAKWWQWALSIPKEVNPVGDETGKYCGRGQEGPVWFLAGTFGGSMERSCTIPAGKAILFSPINVECSYAEFPDLKTESDLKACAKSGQDLTTETDVTIDGVQVQNLQDYRTQSPLFDLTLPEGNVFGLPANTTKAVSDGVWVFLKPLPPGNHEIRSKGVSVDFTTTGTVPSFVSDVTYHLNVNSTSVNSTSVNSTSVNS
jgi:hypothetical protein